MAFKPLHDRVVVHRVDSEDKTSGGLIIPDLRKRNLQKRLFQLELVQEMMLAN